MHFTQEKVNLHTHSFYCRHGSGTIEDYVNRAVSDGLEVLGFSEHCPLPDVTYPENARMDYSELPLYERDVRAAAGRGDIRVLLGAECDWISHELPFYKDDLLAKRGYDYLAVGIHYMVNPHTGKNTYLGHFTDLPLNLLREYVNLYTEGLASGVFLFGCHPDLIFTGLDCWDKNAESASMDIIRCALQYNMPLEINDYGLRKKMIQTSSGPRPPYPVKEFWELARDEGVCIIANSDAHRPEDVAGHTVHTMSFAKELGIEFASYELEERKIRICESH